MLQQGRDALRARLSEGLGGLLPPLRVASIGAPHVEALPLELSMEALVVAPFSWPESCPICFDPLVKHERFLLCSAAHVACLACALGCLRASLEHDVAVCLCAEKGALCYYLKDAIAAAFHGPRLAAAARGVAEEALELAPLSLREVHKLLRGLELAHHERPEAFSFSPCPGCRDPLLLPAQYAATGRPAYCHACTHRVCPRCDVMWAESGHDTRGCGAVQDAKKAAAEDAREVVARALGDERAARCPQCSHAVVKEDQAQCNHIRCICGAEFCYLCTARYTRDVMGVLQCAHSKKCPQNDSHSVRIARGTPPPLSPPTHTTHPLFLILRASTVLTARCPST